MFTPAAALHLEQELAQLILGLQTGETSEVERSQALYRILCGLLLPQRAHSPAENDAVAQAVRFIDSHLTEELPVRSIAAHVNLSTSHFSRIFRASTGFSPHEYIMLHRIDEAKSLLHSTGLSVSEIAFRAGFRRRGQFYRGIPLENRPVPHPVSKQSAINCTKKGEHSYFRALPFV